MTNDDLVRRMAELSDEELLRRLTAGTLTEHTQAVAEAEASRRGLAVAGSDGRDDAAADDDIAPSGSVDIVTLAGHANFADARMLQARLEAEGIPAWIADADTAQTLSHLSIGMGGIRVQVQAHRLEDARRVQAALVAGEYALDDHDPHATTVDADPAILPAGGVPTADVAAYAHHGPYAAAYARLRDRGGVWAGVNVWAFLFGSLWFFHRRMPMAGGAYLLVFAGLAIATSAASPAGIDPVTGEVVLTREGVTLAMLSMRALAFLAASSLYVRKAAAVVRRVRATGGFEGDALHAVLHARGGTTLLVPGVVAIVLVALPKLLQGA